MENRLPVDDEQPEIESKFKLDTLDPELAELLTLLIEESGEVIQAATKIFRAGLDFKRYGGKKTTLDELKEELVDLSLVMGFVMKVIGIDENTIAILADAKMEKLKKWTNVFSVS